MDVMHHHQEEGESNIILVGCSHMDLSGCGNKGHFPPGVSQVGGAFRVIRKEETQNSGMGGQFFRKCPTNGYEEKRPS